MLVSVNYQMFRNTNFDYFFYSVLVHSKQCWVVSTQIWVKYGQTQMLG